MKAKVNTVQFCTIVALKIGYSRLMYVYTGHSECVPPYLGQTNVCQTVQPKVEVVRVLEMEALGL